MVLAFTERFVPETFLHRETQIAEIRQVYENFKIHGYGGNKLIVGPTGSGKTSVTLWVTSQFDNSLYVNVKEQKTANRTLANLTKISKKSDTSTRLQALITILKENPKVLIIDEIDRCTNIKELADCLNTIYRNTGCPIILISSNWSILNIFPRDAYLTILPSRLEFCAYNAHELKDILNNRISIFSKDEPIDFPEGAKQYLCARVNKNFNGSARTMLDIAINCILSNNYTQEFIEISVHKKDTETWVSLVNALSDTEKSFLQTMLEEESEDILTSIIREKMDTLSSSRISQIIRSLVTYGFIKTDSKETGKVGNKLRTVSFIDQETREVLTGILTPYLNT